MLFYLGLPMFVHKPWVDRYFPSPVKSSLQYYSQCFNTVEGNSFFYGIPKANTLLQWRDKVQDSFRFCPKFNQDISHMQLAVDSKVCKQYLQRVSLLADRLGVLFLQLPPHFSGDQYSRLSAFLRALPKEFSYAVEVRHQDYFDRHRLAKPLDQLLSSLNMSRVIFDSRALFAKPCSLDVSIDARRKKPEVPTYVLSTNQMPFVRFIGSEHADFNRLYLAQWAEKIAAWIQQGKKPYFFLHTPSNDQGPDQAAWFYQQVAKHLGVDETLPPWPLRQQLSLL